MILRTTFLLLVSSLFAVSAAQAQKGKPILELNASGELQIAPDGHVSDYKLNGKLTPEVADLIDKNVRRWTFEPVLVDGKAVSAKTELSLALKAEPVGEHDYSLRIVRVNFGGVARVNHDIKPPKYPREAVRAHVGGKVMLAVRLDETGKVVDAMPYQTSLDVRAPTEGEAQRYRDMLEQASIDAAKTWHYNLSETIDGKPIGTSVLVPIDYFLVDSPKSANTNGRWRPFLPGPVHPIPWLQKAQFAANEDVSAIPSDGGLALDSRFKLKDDVVGKTL